MVNVYVVNVIVNEHNQVKFGQVDIVTSVQ